LKHLLSTVRKCQNVCRQMDEKCGIVPPETWYWPPKPPQDDQEEDEEEVGSYKIIDIVFQIVKLLLPVFKSLSSHFFRCTTSNRRVI